MRYKLCLAITGAIHGTSRESLYQELGLESLGIRICYTKITLFHGIVKDFAPQYLLDIILSDK